MKIKQIEIINFRLIDQADIGCELFNTFVGPNGSGKSTILSALNIFFGEISTFSDDDFHNRNIDKPISIKVTFHDLSVSAKDEFKHYVRDEKLIVTVMIKKQPSGNFKKSVHGERLVFEPFRTYFEAQNAKNRGEIFAKLRESYSDIKNATNDVNRTKSVNEFEESLPEQDKILVVSEAEFFGVSKGKHKIQRHINWVYVPAVKDASTESEEAKASHLGKLIQHTIRSGMNYDADLEKIRDDAIEAFGTLINEQKVHLKALQSRLAERLKNAVTTDADLTLEWKKEEKSVSVLEPEAQVLLSDKGFVGEVENFGHGLQRSFLIVILQELMSTDSEISPTLILGCEEPELYQHPPQAKHLASILMELCTGDAQVFITTHSPYFIDVEHYAGIKMFRNSDGKAIITGSTFNAIQQGYNNAFNRELQNEDQVRTKLAIQTQPKFNEIFFAEKVVLVEGISDQACFETFLRLSGKKPQFQKSGTSIIVCEGKSSLAIMLLIANDFDIPFHVIFDCDAGCVAQHQDQHIRDNDAIQTLSGSQALGILPTSHILEDRLSAWHHDIEQVLEGEFGENAEKHNQAGRNAVGNLRNSKKNPLYIAAAMKSAWDDGLRFPIIDGVVAEILK